MTSWLLFSTSHTGNLQWIHQSLLRMSKCPNRKWKQSCIFQESVENSPKTRDFCWAGNLTQISSSGVCILVEITCSKVLALAGNRTRASRVAGENSTTEQPMLWKGELTPKAGNRIIKLFFQEYFPLVGSATLFTLKKSSPFSPSGNWTPVSRVTGGDTHHYTNEEKVGRTFEKTWSIGTNPKFGVLGLNPSNINICRDWMVGARNYCAPSMESWDSHKHVHVIDFALYRSQATQY